MQRIVQNEAVRAFVLGLARVLGAAALAYVTQKLVDRQKGAQ